MQPQAHMKNVKDSRLLIWYTDLLRHINQHGETRLKSRKSQLDEKYEEILRNLQAL
jgi:hypothetical protein